LCANDRIAPLRAGMPGSLWSAPMSRHTGWIAGPLLAPGLLQAGTTPLAQAPTRDPKEWRAPIGSATSHESARHGPD